MRKRLFLVSYVIVGLVAIPGIPKTGTQVQAFGLRRVTETSKAVEASHARAPSALARSLTTAPSLIIDSCYLNRYPGVAAWVSKGKTEIHSSTGLPWGRKTISILRAIPGIPATVSAEI